MKMRISFLLQQCVNKHIVLLIALSTCLVSLSKAQEPISIGIAPNDQACHTPDIYPQEAQHYPWFGNPDYLGSFMDSVRNIDGIPADYSRTSRVVPNIRWRIPIRF